MTQSGYGIKIPGKLMIAGEYAVLEPNQPSVVIAINRYVTAYIKPAEKNILSLPHLGLDGVTWDAGDEGVNFSVSDSRLNFIGNSIEVVNQFLREISIPISPFHLKIESELDDPSSGKKYGLGSSAAVVTAVVAAMLSFHGDDTEPLNLDTVFKLSAIAHLKTQGSGSGADIAAAVYGGWLQYSTFDSKWVLNELNNGESISSIIGKPWPNLSIESLTPPAKLQIAVGWTGQPAATGPRVKMINSFRNKNFSAYENFLKESYASVEGLVKGFNTEDFSEIMNSISRNRKALTELGKMSDVDIETEKLKLLSDIAEGFGSGKSSGAGGGDCGIAFLKSESDRVRLYKSWKEAGITPLNLAVSKNGVYIENIN